MGLAPALAALVVLAGAVVKGAIGFGFPTLTTPALALFVDVRTAVVLLLVPNIAMDAFQAARQGEVGATLRRMAVLLAFGAVGTYAGTWLLVVLPARTAMLVLGTVVVTVVVVNASRWSIRVPPAWTRWLDPVAGLIAGVLGGLTNVPGTPLVLYFVALGLPKRDFVRAVAVSFFMFKVLQLGTVAWFGMLSPWLLGLSLLLTLVALAGFRAGLAIQDRLDQRAFNRATLAILGALGVWLVVRGLVG